ncbi:MAG: hypothetical protein ABFC67_12760, partial [Mizugakiibacter sp.]|uniref:hypothetical protein n=1 Tax=Mizugakiibacter sp. TaxID=1972610 RepID=UPI00320C56ED
MRLANTQRRRRITSVLANGLAIPYALADYVSRQSFQHTLWRILMHATRKLLPVAAVLGLIACTMTRQAESQTATSAGPCATFYASGFQLPQGQIDATVPNVARPAKGVVTKDPVFGTCVVRATAHDTEVQRAFERNDYSRREPFNADMSYF